MAGSTTTVPEAPHPTPHAKRRRRRRRRRGGEVMSLNLLAMIDIVFLLLIFFMLQMRFHQPEGLLPNKLPKSQGVVAGMEVPISPLRVVVWQVGPGPVDYRIRIAQMPPPNPQTFGDLVVRLKGIQSIEGYSDDTPVVLVPDGRVQWDHVINAYNAALRAAYKNIHFASSGEP